MFRLSSSQVSRLLSLPIVLALTSPVAHGQTRAMTCDPGQIRADSYRLTTEAQALNLTRPRVDWWEAFDMSLEPYRDALWDVNAGALAIAVRARELDDRNALAHAQIARQLVVLGEDGARARDEIARLFGEGRSLVWTSTLYDVDAHDYFLTAFDADGIRVYRFAEAAGPVRRRLGIPELPGPEADKLWRALGGCLDGLRAEASVPWQDVHEIKAGHYVLYFKFRTPVRITSDRGSSKTVRELKVALHGAIGTVDYLVSEETRPGHPPTIRGIGIGPTAYQDRIRRTLVSVVDVAGRIRLPKATRGAGW